MVLKKLQKKKNKSQKSWDIGNLKTYCFDIDGTICTNTNGDYESAEPYYDRIDTINNLFNKGSKIIYFTARGSTTQIDWFEITEKQLNKWGCKYNQLLVGKPFADYYIDDKGVDPFNWFSE